MSSAVYVDSAKATADSAHCADCEGDRQCFYDGRAAMEMHAEKFPEHRQVVFLKREIC